MPRTKNTIHKADTGQRLAENLFSEYAERVYRFCLRLCGGNTADAEDLAQDVLLSALRATESFQGRSSTLTYLYRIAINRRQRVRCQTEASTRREQIAAAGQQAFSDPSEQTATRIDIEAAIATLPDDLRIAFLLVKSEGLTYREAARILEVPQGTLQSRVHDAPRCLREQLRETRLYEPASPRHEALPDRAKEGCHAL